MRNSYPTRTKNKQKKNKWNADNMTGQQIKQQIK